MSHTPDNALARFTADAEIRRTLARYCHAIDDGDFAALAECFVPGAQLDAFGRTPSGRDGVIALLAKAMPVQNRGRHLTVNTVIGDLTANLDGTPTAGVLSDFAFIAQDGSVTTGRYADEFVAIDGMWLISRRTITLRG